LRPLALSPPYTSASRLLLLPPPTRTLRCPSTGTPGGAPPQCHLSFPSGHTAREGHSTIHQLVLSNAARRLVSLGCDASASEDDSATQIRVHDVATGACLGLVAYRERIQTMPWFPGSFQFAWPADEAEEHEDEPELHSLTCAAMRGESMLMTGDDSGCLCVWDVGGDGIRHVAALPPPEAESPNEHMIRSLVILDPSGGVEGLAGGSVLCSKTGGRLEKMVPIDKGKLSQLTEQIAWETDEAPESFRHENLQLGELEGALGGLAALGISDEQEATVSPPSPPPPCQS
jgi:hypothetical protein